MGLKLATAVLAGTMLCAGSVLANPYDISLRGLGRPTSTDMSDPAVQRYRALAAELALSMAPRPMQPAETLGVSGFEFSLASTTTDISETAAYWQGQAGSPVMEGVLRGRKVPNVLWTPTAHIRKGLPLSTEVGIHGSYLAFSEMFMLGAEMKIALYESYYRWIPALAARAAVGRLFGSSDLDMLTGEADVLLSIPVGIAGTAQVTPFVGGGLMFSHVNSYVIDETPFAVSDDNDQKGGTTGSLYTFPTLSWKSNRFVRIVGGARFKLAFLELMYELDVGVIQFSKKKLLSHSFKLGFDV